MKFFAGFYKIFLHHSNNISTRTETICIKMELGDLTEALARQEERMAECSARVGFGAQQTLQPETK